MVGEEGWGGEGLGGGVRSYPNRPNNPAFTSGHSSSITLYITVSRVRPLARVW